MNNILYLSFVYKEKYSVYKYKYKYGWYGWVVCDGNVAWPVRC